MYRILRSKTDGLAEDVVSLAQDLVRIKGLSSEEELVADCVERAFRDLGYDQVVRDSYGNVLGIIHGRTGESTLLLCSHLDTASPGNLHDWAGSPWRAEITNGQLHGLGAADCKSGLAAQIYTGALLKRSLLPLDGSLIVAATVMQEEGHSTGVRELMKETLPSLEMRPNWAILGEPTNLGLYYGHEGWVELFVCVESPNPFQVDDAAEAIFETLNARRNHENEYEYLLVRPPRIERTEPERRAIIPIDRRLRPGEAVEAVIHEIGLTAVATARSAGGVAVDTAVRQTTRRAYTGRGTLVRHVTNAWSTDPFSPLMERARHALAAAELPVRPGKWELGRLGMGTAGGVLLQEFGIPTLGYGPGDEAVAHRPNEYVEVENIVKALYGTAVIAHSLIGVPVYGWTSEDI